MIIIEIVKFKLKLLCIFKVKIQFALSQFFYGPIYSITKIKLKVVFDIFMPETN